MSSERKNQAEIAQFKKDEKRGENKKSKKLQKNMGTNQSCEPQQRQCGLFLV